MNYVYACTALGQALMDAFPNSRFVPKLVGLLNAGAMVADYVVSKQISRIKQQRDEQNIYLKQAELYRKEADKLKELRNGNKSKYLQEEGASADVDCFNCATAHIAGMEGALRRAAREAEKEGGCGPQCQKWIHIAAQEPAALFARDWSKEKLEKLPPESRELINKYASLIEQKMQKIAPTPEGEGVLKASALLKESIRFAEAGDDIRHPEVEWRRLQAEAELASSERLRPGTLPPNISQELRSIRRKVGSGITDTNSLIEAAQKSDQLSLKINSRAWQKFTPKDLEKLADEVYAIRANFASDRARLGGLALIGPSTPRGHHRIDEQIIQDFTTASSKPIAGMPEMNVKIAFDNVLRKLEERNIKVRFRDLPTTMNYSIEGLYDRQNNMIALNASKMSKDNYALQSLFHEGAHALLHNEECHPVISRKAYKDMPEEIEAQTVSMAAMFELGFPVELWNGKEVGPDQVQIDWEKIRKKAGPEAEENIKWAAKWLARKWAAKWLARAARGENSELIKEKCPALRRKEGQRAVS